MGGGQVQTQAPLMPAHQLRVPLLMFGVRKDRVLVYDEGNLVAYSLQQQSDVPDVVLMIVILRVLLMMMIFVVVVVVVMMMMIFVVMFMVVLMMMVVLLVLK